MERVDNSFIALKDNGIRIEVGDSKQILDYPQFKTIHWDNECNFSIRLDVDITGGTLSQSGDIIEWKKEDLTSRFYELDKDEYGGFEFEVEFASRPTSDIVNFTIQSKGLNFIYQGELNEWHKKRGDVRPANILGSYAVYHASKKHGIYKTGKAFHLYRPEVIDSDNNRAWCDMIIEDGLLKITMPTDFMDNAIYPVKLDPEFGYHTIGGTTTGEIVGTENMIFCKFEVPENGETISQEWYVTQPDISIDFKVASYNEDTGAIDTLIASSTGVGVMTTVFGWRSCALVHAITGTTFVFAGLLSADWPIFMKYDSGGTNQSGIQSGLSYPTFPNPAVADTYFNDVYSVFYNYTAAGGDTKTVNGLAIASLKTFNGLAKASVKTINGVSV